MSSYNKTDEHNFIMMEMVLSIGLKNKTNLSQENPLKALINTSYIHLVRNFSE